MKVANRLLFFVLVFVLLALMRWPVPQKPIVDVDEAVSALIANNWLDGGVPYRDSIDQRGPVTYGIYAVVFALFGRGNMTAVHGALLVLVFAGCWLGERFARRLSPDRFGEVWGLAAALLLAVCTFTYKRTQFLAFHTEWPTFLLSTLGMLLTWQALRGEPRSPRRKLFVAGLTFGASFFAKQPAIFDGGAAGVFLLTIALFGGRLFRRETWLDAAALAGGFAAALAATVGYFAAHGALADFYLYFWSYNVDHYTAVVPLAEKLAGLNPWDHSRHYLRSNPLLFVGVLVEAARTSWVTARRWRRLERLEEARLLLVLWLAFAYFGASFSGRNFGHYFIQIIAPACLITAGLVVEAWQRIASWSAGRRDLLWGARAVLLLGVLASLTISVHRYHRDLAVVRLGQPARQDATFARLLTVIRERTTPQDSIFVWGYHPEVYLLALRKPASRYTNTNYLTGMLPWENHGHGIDTSEHIVPGAMAILLTELEVAKPRAIIDTAPGDHRFYGKYPLKNYPPLARYLEEKYERAAKVKDRKGRTYYRVYLRKAGG